MKKGGSIHYIHPRLPLIIPEELDARFETEQIITLLHPFSILHDHSLAKRLARSRSSETFSRTA